MYSALVQQTLKYHIRFCHKVKKTTLQLYEVGVARTRLSMKFSIVL